MNKRRVGIWLIGAFGGVGTTAVLGLASLRRGLIQPINMVTALPLFQELDLDQPDQFVVGGHDIRRTNFQTSAQELHQKSNIFEAELIENCRPELEAWAENIRPGTVYNTGSTISRLASLAEPQRPEGARQIITRIQADLQAFRAKHQLEQVVVVNVASTEPPQAVETIPASVSEMLSALEKGPVSLPASALYAWAVLDLGWPYINFTPSLGASFPAALELAQERKALCGGKDGKTGETLMKSVLAPMFACRNFRILSWVGHNIFGNRDGLVLDDPSNKESKIRTKDQVVSHIVGYKPQTHVSIEYIESLDDWKTAWNHIHFQGFLGVKMTLQFIWQGCDSILAAPLVLDLARLALHAQRRGEVGILKHLACFFKSPMGVDEHDFFKQFAMLENYLRPQAV